MASVMWSSTESVTLLYGSLAILPINEYASSPRLMTSSSWTVTCTSGKRFRSSAPPFAVSASGSAAALMNTERERVTKPETSDSDLTAAPASINNDSWA